MPDPIPTKPTAVLPAFTVVFEKPLAVFVGECLMISLQVTGVTEDGDPILRSFGLPATVTVPKATPGV